MTKAEILFIARDVRLMDELNTVSGLLEMNENQETINTYVNDIYKKVNDYEPEHNKPTKAQMLRCIMNQDEELYNKIKNHHFAEVKYEYLKLTEGRNK